MGVPQFVTETLLNRKITQSVIADAPVNIPYPLALYISDRVTYTIRWSRIKIVFFKFFCFFSLLEI